jgi:hypothetical protein
MLRAPAASRAAASHAKMRKTLWGSFEHLGRKPDENA